MNGVELLNLSSSKELSYPSPSVFPNPVADYLTVSFEKPVSGTIHIFNINSQLIKSHHMFKSNSVKLSISDIDIGQYILQFYDQNGNSARQTLFSIVR